MPEGSVPQKPIVPTVPPSRPKPPMLPSRPTSSAGKPVTAAQKEVATVLDNQTIVIRTMQDDLRAARGEKPRATAGAPLPNKRATAATKNPALPRPAKPEGRSGDKGETGGLAISAAPVPLPPKGPTLPVRQPTGAQKVIMPPIKRRHHSHAGEWLLLIFVVAAGGAGAAWWFFGNQLGLPNPWRNPMTTTVPVAHVLPSTSAFIMEYQASSAEERSRLLSVWNAAGRGEPSLVSLLAGDPRLLLMEADITAFYYVFLENEVRPYVVVPQSKRAQELLVNQPEARVADSNGWYIVSAVATAPYLTALEAGALSQRAETVLPQAATDVPLRLFVGPHALITMREALLGSDLGNGVLQELSLAGRLAAGSAPILEVSGRGVTLESTGGSTFAPDGATIFDSEAQTRGADKQANQQLLSLVPEAATFVQVGSNFQRDLMNWASPAGVLDMAVLQQPAVAALLGQLTGSYAFYSVSPNEATRDLGLIIAVPPALRAQLRVPDPTIEGALSALMPLLTGRKAIAPIDFTTHTHTGVMLRYANFSQPSQALDYALIDTYVVLATSREAMFSLLETIQGIQAPLASSATWQPLLSSWGALPAASQVLIGSLDVPQFTPLFPTGSETAPLFGLAIEPTSEGAVSGIVVLPIP